MRVKVQTPDAPQPIGPYSQAIVANGFMFLSGQVGVNPSTGEMAGDVVAQATQVIANLRSVLAAEGLTFEHVVKTTIFLTDLADFGRVNDVYGACFAADPPARATVQVAALPRGAKVEIEAVAALP